LIRLFDLANLELIAGLISKSEMAFCYCGNLHPSTTGPQDRRK
jgi:predicted ATP-grasp superfamily ATP-dependent carboligase